MNHLSGGSGMPSNKTMASDITVGSIGNFKPKVTSTPLMMDPIVSDPEDVYRAIEQENQSIKRKSNKMYYQKIMATADEVARKIHQDVLAETEDPIEAAKRRIRKVYDVSVEEKVPEKEQSTVKSNGYWNDHNKTIPAPPEHPIPDQIRRKVVPEKTPSVFLSPPIRVDKQGESRLDNTFDIFESPMDFLNESQQDINFSFKDSPIVAEQPFNFATPGSQFVPEEKLKFLNESIFNSPSGADRIFSENVLQSPIASEILEDLDNSFAEFRSPPVSSHTARQVS